MQLQQHPLSAIFPSLPDDELKALAADIKTHGLHSAITIYKGEVLDGWHRYRACAMVGVNPRTMEYKGSDPVAFVKSANWHRRHLTASQRGFTETGLVQWKPSGDPKGGGVQNCTPAKSVAEMAEDSGTSERTIQQSKVVHTNGTDTLKEAVKEGKIAVSKAAKIAKLPKEKQAKAMAEPKKKKAKPAKPAPDEDYSADLAKELESAATQITNLQAVVESLKKSDLAAEVLKWKDKFERLDGRLQQCVTSKNEAEKQARYSTGLLAKIRAALKVEKNSEILAAIRQ